MNAPDFQVLCLSPTGWILVVLVLLLAGCGGIPIGAHPTEEFVDAGQARSLIGMTKDTVQERFGDPDWEVGIVDKTYLIYAASGEVDWVWEI